jgi:hypothetical protein
LEKEWLTTEEESEWCSLHDLNNLNYYSEYFEKCSNCGKRAYKFFKATSKIIVEIWIIKTRCYKCKKITPVIWPVDASINSLTYSIRFDTFEKLPSVLSKEFPFFKSTLKKTQNVEAFGNLCTNCGSYQGDYYILEEYLEAAYYPETADIKYVEVELNDLERLYFSEKEKVLKLHHPRKGNHSALCEDCYKLYKYGNI